MRIVTLASMTLLAGCPGEGPPDGPVDAGTDASAPSIAAPQPVSPPTLGACPAGWAEMSVEGTTVCEPWPAGPVACDATSFQLPGRAACEEVGSPCPAGDFAEDAPAGAIFVLEGAMGGDGSRAAPLGTIGEAMAMASAGDTVAVGRGRYVGAVEIPADVTLLGACAAEVVIAGPAALAAVALVEARGTGVVIRDVQIVDAGKTGLCVPSSTGVTVERVVIARATGSGVLANGGMLRGRRLLVRDTGPDPSDLFGCGVDLTGGGTAELSETVLSNNRAGGALVGGASGSLSLADSVIRDTRSQLADDDFGRGVTVDTGATATLERVVVEGNADVGVIGFDAPTRILAAQVLIRGTRPRDSDGEFGRGFQVQEGAAGELRRSWIERNREAGVMATIDASLRVVASVIADTAPTGAVGGRGINVEASSAAAVERALVARNQEVGLLGHDSADVMLTDVSIVGTESRASDGTTGRGLVLQQGTQGTADRLLVAGNRDIAIMVTTGGASLVASDLEVRDTQGRMVDGLGGRGVSVEVGATMELRRASITANREFGVLAIADGASLRGTDVRVRDTAGRQCADDTCVDAPFGVGVGAYLDATVSLERFSVGESELCGVHLAGDGAIDLVNGEVADSPIGACVQVPGYDVDRLARGVRYIRNAVNLDATSLPVPEPGQPLGP